MNREKNLAINSFILFVGNVLPKIAGIITLPIITAGLSVSEYGTYDLVLTMATLILPITTLEIHASAFRYLIKCKDNLQEQKKIISNILFFTIPISFLTLTILYFFLRKYSAISKFLILVYYFFDTFLKTIRQIVRGLGNNKTYSKSVVFQSIVELLGVIIVISFFRQGLSGLLFVLNISQIISIVYILIKEKVMQYVNIKLVSFDVIKELLSYSWPLIPNSLSSWVMRASDRLIISAFLGIESIAVYAVANKLPNIFSLIQSTFTQAWQENASIVVNDADSGEYYGNVFQSILNLLLGIIVVIISFTPFLFPILIQGDYGAAYYQIPILFLGVFFGSLSSFFGGIYIAHMKSKAIGYTTILAAIINVIINVLFIKKIGIYAASISTFLSYLILTIYRAYDVKKIIDIKIDYVKTLSKISILFLITIISYKRTTFFNLVNICLSLLFAIILNKDLIESVLSKILHKIKRS